MKKAHVSNSKNFWQALAEKQQPFCALAPMDDVTDLVFRQLVTELAPADVYFTEFASVEGFCSPGRHAVERRLRLADGEQGIVAQIWGTMPEKYNQTAQQLSQRGFVGIDINMGCPVRDVIKTGACSGLIRTPDLAAEIIVATKKGAGNLPVSVKTRLGFTDVDIEGWLGFLLEQDITALTVHLRTVREQSKVDAHWELADQIAALRDRIAPQTILIMNGDIADRADAKQKLSGSGVEGAMIGRGIFHNPWAFSPEASDHSKSDRIAALLRHLELFEQTWTDGEKRFEPLKRFFKIYIQGFDGAAEMRNQLMVCKDIVQARGILDKKIAQNRL
ncbi:tRNA-dihydrouridine synthase [bacterium]|nr:tRNA-dihydrouridine synthase [bacterium]